MSPAAPAYAWRYGNDRVRIRLGAHFETLTPKEAEALRDQLTLVLDNWEDAPQTDESHELPEWAKNARDSISNLQVNHNVLAREQQILRGRLDDARLKLAAFDRACTEHADQLTRVTADVARHEEWESVRRQTLVAVEARVNHLDTWVQTHRLAQRMATAEGIVKEIAKQLKDAQAFEPAADRRFNAIDQSMARAHQRLDNLFVRVKDYDSFAFELGAHNQSVHERLKAVEVHLEEHTTFVLTQGGDDDAGEKPDRDETGPDERPYPEEGEGGRARGDTRSG